MTVNYTTLLALGQPVTGTESGTWGDDVNNAVTSYLDIAIAGTLTLTGDGAVTLANTQGTSTATNISSTTAQYYIIKVVGPLTATKVITAPSTSKTYIVNNTDSTYGVTVKASGQTGVTVAAGQRALVVFNGTDYVQVGASAGGSNTQVQYNNSGALAGSANFTFDGTNVQIGSQGDLRLGDSDNSNWVAFQAPATVASNVTWTLPNADGTANQVLQTNGSGTLSWSTISAGAALSNDTSTASNLYPMFAAVTSGTPTTVYTSNAKLLYKPSTGEFQASELVASNGLILNNATVSASYTVPTGSNAMSVGPITVASGQSVTVSSGQRWIVL